MQLIEKILPWEPQVVYGVGDLQLGSAGCVSRYFQADMDEARADNALLIGLGDMVDFVRPTMRKLLRISELDTEAMDALAVRATELEQQFLRMAEGTDWVGMVEGHHYFDYMNGATSDTRIAEALETTFLGDSAIVRLTFKKGGSSHRQTSIDIFVWHGEGSGGAEGGFRRLAKKAAHWPDCDILLMGHISQLGTRKFIKNRMTKSPNLSLVSNDCVLGLTGGYQIGYVEGLEVGGRPQGTYVEQRGLDPVALGCLRLYLTPTDEGVRVRASA